VAGCVAPVVVGGKDRTILIYLDPKKLEARRVSPLDVVKALKAGNLMVTPGTAYFGGNQVLLDTNVMVTDVHELNNFPIRSKPGDNVYLRDIGKAEDSYSIQTSRVRIASKETDWEGRRQVYVPIYRQQGASSLDVANGVRKHIAFMEERLPQGTKLEFVMDQSLYVKEAIFSLIHEGLLGAALVSVMILLFLGNFRMTLIASLSIPLAIVGACACLFATGNTINAMTLGGLALAIGPLVDDAIVALENIHRHKSLGKSYLRAALDGSAEVMVPVLVATCTTTIVLAPLALIPGMGGFLFKPLALAVAFAMLTSFLLSRTFVPMTCAKFLPDHQPRTTKHQTPNTTGTFARLHHHFESFLDHRVTRTYSLLLERALRHRTAVLAAVAVLFVASLALSFGIGREFFPQVDAGQITMYVRTPSNLRLDAAEKRLAEVEAFVKQHVPAADREMIITELGLDPDWSAAYTANSGQQDAVLRIQLQEHRGKSSQEYAILLRHAFADDPRFNDLRLSFDTGGMVSTALNYGASSPIDVEVSGGTPEQGFELAKEIRNRIADVRGAADVRLLQRQDAPYRVIDVDRQKAASVGLSAEDVILQVVAAMNSSVTINRNFWIDTKTGNQYFVAVQYPEDPETKIEDVLNVFATGTNQPRPVKLSSLATLRRESGAVEINHSSLARTYNVLVNTENRDIGGVARDVEKRLQGLKPEKGVRWKLKGEYARMNDSSENLLGGLAMAAVLVYLLQVALFRSWAGPFVIMFTVPLGLIGVLGMLFLTNTTLNVQSQMGVIFLVGIAVNNGVLLVEFANKQRRAGLTVAQAIQAAASIRFRPILMTFLATFLGLVPMAVGMGRGSEANVPLARAVVGGLLTSTALTLFVVPIMYTLLIRDPLPPEVDLEAELAGGAGQDGQAVTPGSRPGAITAPLAPASGGRQPPVGAAGTNHDTGREGGQS
jgi:multidrug efflux pump subunit AcrB